MAGGFFGVLCALLLVLTPMPGMGSVNRADDTPVLDVSKPLDSVGIGKLLMVAKDVSLGASVEQMITAPQAFARWHRDDLNLGITARATWIRLEVRNSGPDPVRWYLDMGDGLIGDVTLYEVEPSGQIRGRSTGLEFAWSTRDVPLSQVVFSLQEPAASKRTLYLRVVAGFGKRLLVRAHAPESLPRVTQLQSMGWGALMGVFAGIGAYHFVLFLLLRDIAFFWHAALMAAALASRLLIHSFGLESIWPQGYSGYGSLNLVFTALVFFCALMFALQVLPLRDVSPWWRRLLSALRWCWLVVLVVSVVWPGAQASMALTAIGLPTQMVVLGAAVAAWRTGSVVARWFLPAWLVLIVGGLIWSARNMGWVPLNDWTLIAGSLGLALHTLLISAGLAQRMREEQQTRLEVQQQLAEERRVANQQLERRVQERTLELQAERDRAEAASQTKDLVVRLVSHDLRSPLASIVAASERLAETPTASVGIRQTAMGLIRLIDRFLDLDYLRSGSLSPHRAWVSARALAERQVALLGGLVQAKDLMLQIDVPEGARLFADPALMGEVVGNLLGNAVKACPQGGHVRVTWSDDPPGLWVEDDGPGFGKLPSAGRSSGIGLDHCRAILKVHGGQLQVTAPPQGARVGFELPAVGPRVLVVDDQPAQCAVIAQELQRIWPSCEVCTAADGQAGWEAMRHERPDLVILDRLMPGLDGLGLLKRIRQDPQTQSLPVLMVSSVSSSDEASLLARTCLAAGADAFLGKPLDDNAFEATVCALLLAEDDV